MPPAAPDLAARLECLADRLPKFRAALLAQPRGSLRLTTAQRGDVLLRRGDTAHALYVIADGLLRATVARADGSELTLSELRVGFSNALVPSPRHLHHGRRGAECSARRA